MSAFSPDLFGITMGQLTAEYRATYTWLAPVTHVATIILLILIIRYGQRARKAFAAYFTLNYIWLLAFVGGWFSLELYNRLGVPSLAIYAATPALLAVILALWITELKTPKLDLDFRNIQKWRLLVATPFFVWGFWYPPYIWAVGLDFNPAELLFGAYGLMGCPTTMIPLSLMFLKYPKTNRRLFTALTMYAVFIGAAMVALRYVPDIPFFFLGAACLALVVGTKLWQRKTR